MSTENNRAALAAPVAISVGELNLLASPPTPADFLVIRDELCRQCVAAGQVMDPIKALGSSLKDLPPEYRSEAIREAIALKSGGGVEPSPDALQARMYTPDGAAFVLWLLASRNHQGLKLEEVRGVVGDADVARSVLAQLGKLLSADEKKESGASGSGGSS